MSRSASSRPPQARDDLMRQDAKLRSQALRLKTEDRFKEDRDISVRSSALLPGLCRLTLVCLLSFRAQWTCLRTKHAFSDSMTTRRSGTSSVTRCNICFGPFIIKHVIHITILEYFPICIGHYKTTDCNELQQLVKLTHDILNEAMRECNNL